MSTTCRTCGTTIEYSGALDCWVHLDGPHADHEPEPAEECSETDACLCGECMARKYPHHQQQLCGAKTMMRPGAICTQPYYHVTGHLYESSPLRAWSPEHLEQLHEVARAARFTGLVLDTEVDGYHAVYEYERGVQTDRYMSKSGVQL